MILLGDTIDGVMDCDQSFNRLERCSMMQNQVVVSDDRGTETKLNEAIDIQCKKESFSDFFEDPLALRVL